MHLGVFLKENKYKEALLNLEDVINKNKYNIKMNREMILITFQMIMMMVLIMKKIMDSNSNTIKNKRNNIVNNKYKNLILTMTILLMKYLLQSFLINLIDQLKLNYQFKMFK